MQEQKTPGEIGGKLTLEGRLVAYKKPRREAVGAEEQLQVREQVSSILKREGVTEAVRIADGSSESISADHQSGLLRHQLRGHSPQGEQGTWDVCQRLVQRLNREGANWGPPSKPRGPEQGIDWEARDGERVLRIQVTNAVRDTNLWRSLGRHGTVSDTRTVEQAADDLRDAIKHKSERKITIKEHRGEITLALRATHAAGHAFSAVTQAFKKRHGSWASGLGFESIWVVGPNETLTVRLDD